jgi:SsrA-binding protein
MGVKIITRNKRASYDYALQEKFEAGIELKGTEVKSIRNGKVQMNESFVTIDKNDEVWIQNMMIPHYEFGNINNHKETRRRKLLLNKKEIKELQKGLSQKGLTIIPTAMYFKKSFVKVEIALGKGKKLHDKRADSAKKDIERKLRQGKYD